MRCKEKREERAEARSSGSTTQLEAGTASLRDRALRGGNFVAKARKCPHFLRFRSSYPARIVPTISVPAYGDTP